MPPRGKKSVAVKKGTPKAKKQEPPTPSPAPVVVEEETKTEEVPLPSSSVTEAAAVMSDALETNQEDKVAIVVAEKAPESEKETTGDDVVVIMEVTSTTTVEETKVVEENNKVVEEVTKVVEEEETKVVEEEETKVVEETIEDNKPETADKDVDMVGNGFDEEPEVEGEDAEESEEEGDEQDDDEEQGGEEALAEETIVDGERNDDTVDNEGDNKEGEVDSSESDDEDDDDPLSYMQLPFTERKTQKELEIFVGGLDRKAVEEDITKVFGRFGEIQSLRIVKHPITQKSKGFAFLRYATLDQAKKVLTELKDGIEVKGKRVGISASQDSDTLYVGNICKTWTKEKVLEALKTLGIEQIEETYLPEDPNNEGKIRGFALLEFSTHSDAMGAFQRLRKPDAVLGRDRSAKVAFAQSMHPSEEALSQVKTVYVEGLTDSWEEEKFKEFCKQYGEVEKIKLSRNLVKTKRKDFGFVTFASRENALACVEGINKAEIGEGDIKIKANLSKPEYKGRLGKATRGGYKVTREGGKKEAGPSKMKVNANSKGAEAKEKVTSKSKSGKGKGQSNSRGNASQAQGASAPSKSDRNHQRKENPGKGKKRDGRSIDAGNNRRPSKKSRGNTRGGFGNRMNNSRPLRARPSYGMAPAVYADPYRQGYAAAGSSYHGNAYGAAPGSSHSYSDMQPHAGYLKPGTRKPAHDVYGYGQRSAGGYGAQASSGTSYAGGSALPPPYPHSYPGYPGYSGGGGYVYPSSGGYPPRHGYY